MSNDNKELKDRVAIVTGSSRGIGKAIAERLAAAGATVVLAARSVTKADDLPGTTAETQKLIESRGGKAVSIQCDIEDRASRQNLINETIKKFGRIDILVNNAGRAILDRIEEMKFDDSLSQTMQYYLAPVDFMTLVLPQMMKQKEGWIVNVGSSTVHFPKFEEVDLQRGGALYGGLKAALHRTTVGFAVEARPLGISVNIVAPVGAIFTPSVSILPMADMIKQFAEPIEHIAEATLALVSADPKKVSGEIAYSFEYLDKIGRSTMSLDGTAVFQQR